MRRWEDRVVVYFSIEFPVQNRRNDGSMGKLANRHYKNNGQ
jgi:hypothetical protein